MKRSEMLKSMQEFFINNYKGNTYLQVMDMLLSHIENEGMVPPTTIVEFGNGEIYSDNCWDKEDSDENTSTTDN